MSGKIKVVIDDLREFLRQDDTVREECMRPPLMVFLDSVLTQNLSIRVALQRVYIANVTFRAEDGSPFNGMEALEQAIQYEFPHAPSGLSNWASKRLVWPVKVEMSKVDRTEYTLWEGQPGDGRKFQCVTAETEAIEGVTPDQLVDECEPLFAALKQVALGSSEE